MALPTAYLSSTKNLAAIFEALRKAAVPETFTYEFLKQLGFASSTDRPLIPVMKALGFLDLGGRPTPRYREFKDATISGAALAVGMKSAYSDVFNVDAQANRLSTAQLSGIFARLSDKGESVTSKMATTFHALANLADWDVDSLPTKVTEVSENTSSNPEAGSTPHRPDDTGTAFALRHDIHIHLPLSTDVAVFDAIFRSLKDHLL